MIHRSTDYIPIFLENVAWKAPFATLYSNSTTSECENVLKTLATGPAVAHPYSFWTMGSSPGALSFLTWAPSVLWILLFLSLLQHSQFNWWCCLYLLALHRPSYWRYIEKSHWVCAWCQQCRRFMLLVSPSSWTVMIQIPLVSSLCGTWIPGPPDHITGEITNSWGFFPCFGYLHNLALSHALFVVLIEIPPPTEKELNFSTEAVRLPQAWFVICLISDKPCVFPHV